MNGGHSGYLKHFEVLSMKLCKISYEGGRPKNTEGINNHWVSNLAPCAGYRDLW
jgi:hypothetical protein